MALALRLGDLATRQEEQRRASRERFLYWGNTLGEQTQPAPYQPTGQQYRRTRRERTRADYTPGSAYLQRHPAERLILEALSVAIGGTEEASDAATLWIVDSVLDSNEYERALRRVEAALLSRVATIPGVSTSDVARALALVERATQEERKSLNTRAGAGSVFCIQEGDYCTLEEDVPGEFTVRGGRFEPSTSTFYGTTRYTVVPRGPGERRPCDEFGFVWLMDGRGPTLPPREILVPAGAALVVSSRRDARGSETGSLLTYGTTREGVRGLGVVPESTMPANAALLPPDRYQNTPRTVEVRFSEDPSQTYVVHDARVLPLLPSQAYGYSEVPLIDSQTGVVWALDGASRIQVPGGRATAYYCTDSTTGESRLIPLGDVAWIEEARWTSVIENPAVTTRDPRIVRMLRRADAIDRSIRLGVFGETDAAQQTVLREALLREAQDRFDTEVDAEVLRAAQRGDSEEGSESEAPFEQEQGEQNTGDNENGDDIDDWYYQEETKQIQEQGEEEGRETTIGQRQRTTASESWIVDDYGRSIDEEAYEIQLERIERERGQRNRELEYYMDIEALAAPTADDQDQTQEPLEYQGLLQGLPYAQVVGDNTLQQTSTASIETNTQVEPNTLIETDTWTETENGTDAEMDIRVQAGIIDLERENQADYLQEERARLRDERILAQSQYGSDWALPFVQEAWVPGMSVQQVITNAAWLAYGDQVGTPIEFERSALAVLSRHPS